MDALKVATALGARVVPLTRSPFRVGRDDVNDLILSAHPTVTRHHAVLELVAGRWVVRDLGSRNRTYVNGLVATGPTPLRVGDVIVVGDVSMTLEADLDDHDPAVETMDVDDLTGPRTGGLTPRELEVLRRLAAGMTDKAIGRQLQIKAGSVQGHLDRIRRKTGLARRAELALFANGLGLVP